MRHIIKFDVTAELIAQALALPEGSHIEHIVPSSSIVNAFTFIVENPDLPAVEEGDPVPQTTPLLTANYDNRPATWITFDWKLTA